MSPPTQIASAVPASRIDLYRQMGEVCPAVADLSALSHEEVTSRLQFYGNLAAAEVTPSFNRLQCSPEGGGSEGKERQLEDFCAFSQPSIRNFL
jgi:hypothetical protein